MSAEIRKIFINDTKILYRNNKQNILEAINIKNN